MSGVLPPRAGRKAGVAGRSNSDHRPHRHVHHLRTRVEHHAGGFAGGDDVDCRRPPQPRLDVGVLQRALDQAARVYSVNRAAQNRVEL